MIMRTLIAALAIAVVAGCGGVDTTSQLKKGDQCETFRDGVTLCYDLLSKIDDEYRHSVEKGTVFVVWRDKGVGHRPEKPEEPGVGFVAGEVQTGSEKGRVVWMARRDLRLIKR